MKIIFLICLLFSAVSFAQETLCHKYNKLNPTQEPASGPSCRVVGSTFYFEGAVTEDMFYELRDHLAHIKHVELNSYGGLVEAALRIADLVRENKLTTNVRKNAKCASACTLIYQAGVKRSAHPSVRFLYHGARLSNLWFDNWLELRYLKGREVGRAFLADQFSEVEISTETIFNKYISLGMSPEFITDYRAMAESKTWFYDGNFTKTKDLIISSPKLIKYNIVQDFDLRDSVFEETNP